MRAKTSILMGLLGAVLVAGGWIPSAYGKHNTNPQKVHFKVKKNQGQFGGNYMAPKKQKKPTGWYRSTLTGKTVYGKPPKQQHP